MHQELDVKNLEGIDVVLICCKKMILQRNELTAVKNALFEN
jgi:hypothetical protein